MALAAPTTASSSPSPEPGSSRLYGLDALRGIAVFLMIEQHLGVWLWQGPAPGRSRLAYPGLVGFNALGGGAAPLFITLAGVGSALYLARAPAGAAVDRVGIGRGVVLLGFGLLLNLLTPSWFSWGSWFVLHMMGLAMATTPLWRRMPTAALLGLALAVLALTPVVQAALGTPLLLTNDRMRDVTLPGGPARLALAEGQFPVLPWLAFFLCGMAVGRAIATGGPRAGARRAAALAATAIALFAALAGAWAAGVLGPPGSVGHRAGRLTLGFFPASPAMASGLLAIALLAIAGFAMLDARNTFGPRHPLVCLGRASLTLLLLHVWLFREASRPLGLWQANDATTSLLILLGFVVLATFAARAWARIDYRYGAEWCLRRLAG